MPVRMRVIEETGMLPNSPEKNKSNNMKSRRNTKPIKQVLPGKKKVWNWVSYLEEEQMPAAPLKLFREVQGYRIRLHFDGYPECYDFWANADSSDIHPVGWCEKTSHKLLPPKGFKEGEFNWTSYLKNCKAQAAPKSLFKTLSTRPAHAFQVNMKLEAVDRRNPILIRVATIVDRDNHRVKIHFDGWDPHYDLWVDSDSPDIHPVGWCAKTGHALQVPLGAEDAEGAVGQVCPTPGCQGIGHVRGPRYGTHYTVVGCPYSDVNLNRDNPFQDRLGGDRPAPGNAMQRAKRLETPAPFLLGAGESSQGDSPQSRKSAADSEKWCQSSVHTPSEQSENTQERDWGEEDSSADIKAAPKTLGCSHAYIKFQLVKQQSNGKDPDLDLQQALHQSIFMPSLASNPTHRLHLFWEQHCRLLPEVCGLTAKQVAKWTVEEVVNFVQRLPGCKEQASVFREEQIDGEAFLLLKQNDIVKILSIKLGPALKIYNAILMFKSAEDN
ncbi:hypothetical protein WISP_27916 [Willisornis vidua]|uniref:SAM domain-containing protein n=1 Tax=Willisornis vidua TaxID=1566151 RepID=A0ABQ9DMD5_9PASS|nr:hypothetical protein WISP_27916 [Willisornis vidua]